MNITPWGFLVSSPNHRSHLEVALHGPFEWKILSRKMWLARPTKSPKYKNYAQTPGTITQSLGQATCTYIYFTSTHAILLLINFNIYLIRHINKFEIIYRSLGECIFECTSQWVLLITVLNLVILCKSNIRGLYIHNIVLIKWDIIHFFISDNRFLIPFFFGYIYIFEWWKNVHSCNYKHHLLKIIKTTQNRFLFGICSNENLRSKQLELESWSTHCVF